MIKGISKKVFVIRDTKSDIFEEAIFIMKPQSPPLSDHTLKREAEKIISEKTAIYLKNAERRKKLFLKIFDET
ncbi:MAG: hypothetical protein DBX47_05480 [Clostridiales bacterium]|nr:MAG: hypothetical protein DBX47_05480 [Clostridiales bacterium]